MKGKTNVVQIENWSDLMIALESKYTLPLSEVCESLKASRSWVNKFIRPHIPAVYISSGIVNGRQRVMLNGYPIKHELKYDYES